MFAFRPANFNIKCKNCTIQGSIELVAGSFTVAPSANANEPVVVNRVNETWNYVDHGYMKFRSNNFAAHIELDNSIKASALLTNYTAPLPTIAITPFQVCGSRSNNAGCVAENGIDTGHRKRRTFI